MSWLTGRRRPKRPRRSLKRRLLDRLLRLPPGLLERVGGGRVTTDGRHLDPIYPFLLRFANRGRAPQELRPEEARSSFLRKVELVGPDPLLMDRIEDRHVETDSGTVPVRVYLPPNLAEDPAPAVVFYHGGGWVQGDLESHHALCTLIAQRVPCRVVAVDYRLAPEHPYPAAVDDALAAYRWVATEGSSMRIDPQRIAVMGDNAGGNLATVTCIQLRDLARREACDVPQPCAQVLLYPITDWPRDRDSYQAFGEGLVLDRATIEWFFERYVDGDGTNDPRVAPLRSGDLSDLPPAFIATAFFDILRDECRDYAKALEQSGVEVRHFEFPGQAHGFASMTGVLPSARTAVDEICSELAYRFHRLKV
ncbi:MAG: alpha/beta hydrolase [Thermoanaerobaculia bacterium]|nr:alpha/beta hydrolase [Thermoanaerobaculia bacterium]